MVVLFTIDVREILSVVQQIFYFWNVHRINKQPINLVFDQMQMTQSYIKVIATKKKNNSTK